jgi:hypothetical protein
MADHGVFIDAQLSDAERRARLYAGDIFLFSPTPASLAFVEFAREMLWQGFGSDPETVHERHTPEEVAAVLATLKPAFIHHPRSKQLVVDVIASVGGDLDETYFDVPRLRSAYPHDFLTSGIAYAFHPHRDTWYSAPHNQINWWLPVFDPLPDNAMGFYPDFFDKPVKNNSEIYNYYQWNANSRVAAAAMVGKDTREQPKPQEEVPGPSVKFLPRPGGLIMFSGAQLHESVPNTSGISRYSIDFRVVNAVDAAKRIGAANVDSRCTGHTMRDYLRASDPTQRLPQQIVELYDDGTENAGVLVFG